MRTYKYLIPSLIFSLLIIGCCANADEIETLWIDVRTPAEYASGHVDGAVNIEFQHIEAKISELTDDKSAEIRLYCRSGRRSSVAKQSLLKLGYHNVSNEGGYAAALVAHKNSQNIKQTTR